MCWLVVLTIVQEYFSFFAFSTWGKGVCRVSINVDAAAAWELV